MTGRSWSDAESEAAFAALGDRLIDATRRFNRSTRRQRLQAALYTVDDRELTLAQVDALEVIAASGELRMQDVADRLGIDPSTATRTTAPLVDLGLLARATDPANRRFVVLRCTTKGRRTADRITNGRRRLMRDVLAGMAPARRLLLADLLDEFNTLTDHHRAGTNGRSTP